MPTPSAHSSRLSVFVSSGPEIALPAALNSSRKSLVAVQMPSGLWSKSTSRTSLQRCSSASSRWILLSADSLILVSFVFANDREPQRLERILESQRGLHAVQLEAHGL